VHSPGTPDIAGRLDFDWSLFLVVFGYGAAMWPVSKLVVTSHGALS